MHINADGTMTLDSLPADIQSKITSITSTGSSDAGIDAAIKGALATQLKDGTREAITQSGYIVKQVLDSSNQWQTVAGVAKYPPKGFDTSSLPVVPDSPNITVAPPAKPNYLLYAGIGAIGLVIGVILFNKKK